MRDNETIDGYDFEWISDGNGYSRIGFYQCRGEVYYDDDHDEQPEPELWRAAIKLETKLIADGEKAEADHSEKGWVEVSILK
jgi:hypothetical protein